MISYNTYFKTVLNQYESKLKSNPSFFNNRTEQEALGFLVAVTSFKDEILRPTEQSSDNMSVYKKLPITSNSYIESDIGKWLYEVEILAREKARSSNDLTLSNEEIVNKIFYNTSKKTPSSEIRLEIFLDVITFIIFPVLSLSLLFFIKPFSPSLTKLLNITPVNYIVLSFFLVLSSYSPSILPNCILNSNKKKILTKRRKYLIVLIIITDLYLIPYQIFEERVTKATILLALTIFLALIIRALFENTSIPQGYHDIDARRMKIFIEILTAELTFTSTILFLKQVNDMLNATFKDIPYFLFLLLFEFIIALSLSSVGTKCFDKLLYHQ